jgi:murein L,D-transpeptidase YafK
MEFGVLLKRALLPILLFFLIQVWVASPILAAPVVTPPSSEPSPSDPVFNYCFQGQVGNSRIVVVDKARQRLMVFHYMGELVLEHEYPCATGSRAGHKISEGDERTPVGIYFTTHRYNDTKVTIFGKRAIHLNFPNPFDQVAGRKGNGIYIHGTNQSLKARSSNGCIVLRNQDLDYVAPLIADQMTPVVVLERLRLPKEKDRIAACNYLLKLESSPLGHAAPKLGHQLALREAWPKDNKGLKGLAPRLAGLGKGRAVKVENRGMVLLGLGGKWVLVSDQDIKGPKNKSVTVTRRFYLDGENAPESGFLQGQWILANAKAATNLAAWAPKLAPAPKPAPAKPAAPPETPDMKVRQTLAAWLKAWQAKNLRAYMRYYAPGFSGAGKDRRAWLRHKAYLNKVYKKITVRAENLKVRVKGRTARVSFVQHYQSDWHKDIGLKEMSLVHRKGRWQIIKEEWQSLPTS